MVNVNSTLSPRSAQQLQVADRFANVRSVLRFAIKSSTDERRLQYEGTHYADYL